MTIRITGMNSGLDTETIINELASARSVKVTSLQKAQTKLSWKIDAWKSLNTKIYGLYTDTLSDMRLTGSYSKKTTKVSNANAVSVITGSNAINGTQKLNITKLAATGYLTGGKITSVDGTEVKSDTTLAQLGLADGKKARFTLEMNGEQKELEFDSSSTINDVVKALKDEGLNANFDAATGRIFASATKSGKASDFSLTAADAESELALGMLGLNDKTVSLQSEDAFRAELVASYKARIEELKIQKDNATLTQDDIDAIEEKITELQGMLKQDAGGNFLDELSDAGLSEAQIRYEEYKNATSPVIDKINANLATKIDGRDAEIYLNGAKFEFDSNTFEINGLTFTISQVTDPSGIPSEDNAISVTTETDTSGIYNMIKDLFKKYNELIKEMDTLYNADSASKYEPLTNEEKDEMSDKEIEEWEKKIKDSLLRRDSTLGTVASAMKEIMLKGFTVTDKDGNSSTKYLSSFGISTLSYFKALDNEKGMYHIDGDEDDADTKNNPDLLKTAIASDPDMVTSFFAQLNTALYEKLGDLMGRTDYSSAYKVYNDKLLDTELKGYDSKISDAQKKMNDYTDKWYKKFSEMEVALSKLNSKTSAITNMLG